MFVVLDALTTDTKFHYRLNQKGVCLANNKFVKDNKKNMFRNLNPH